ncbi:MAG: hypothetical protein LBR74_01395 [Eubacterium sp.]|jgi:tRNA nucleotidyltransferase (CCA-adding enzyme)|nr:hypothetical protein [Eubacterium sp.]
MGGDIREIKIKLPDRINDIIKKLNEHSYKAHIAGKCVRGIITGFAVDFDIITNAPVERILNIFKGYQINDENLIKGELIIYSGTMSVLVTPYRKGFDNDGLSIYTDSIFDDLGNRDFTFNAIAFNEDEGFVDPFHGLSCLEGEMKIIKAICKDVFFINPLSILTALELYSSDEQYVIAEKTKEWIFECADNIFKDYKNTESSAYDFTGAFNRVIGGKQISAVLSEYKNVFISIIPEFKMIDNVEQHRSEHYYDMLTHTIKSVGFAPPVLSVRYALLFHSLGKPDCFSLDKNGCGQYGGHAERSKIYAARIMRRLGFNEGLIDEVSFLIKHHDDKISIELSALKERLKIMSKEQTIKLLQFKYADMRAMSPEFEGAAMKYKKIADLVKTEI